jgi:predicted ABC-type ATPase
MPTLYVVAGSNGVGKSSLFPVTLFNTNYFVGDDIAAVLNNRSGYLINPDFFLKNNFHELPEEVRNSAHYHNIPPEIKNTVSQLGINFIKEHLKNNKSFAIETTLVDRYMIDVAKIANQRGFHTRMYYIGVDSVDICLERIHFRAIQGHPYLPEQFVMNNYYRSLENLPAAMQEFQRTNLFDNSFNGIEPELVMSTCLSKDTYINPNSPVWLRESLANTSYDLDYLKDKDQEIAKRIAEIVNTPKEQNFSKSLYLTYAREALSLNNEKWDENIDQIVAKSMLNDRIKPSKIKECLTFSPNAVGLTPEQALKRSTDLIKIANEKTILERK